VTIWRNPEACQIKKWALVAQFNPYRLWNAEFIRQHLPAKASVPAVVPAAIVGHGPHSLL
jgi:hypothetical protein